MILKMLATTSAPTDGPSLCCYDQKTEHIFSAYVPDLPGCVASGSSREHAMAEIRDAIAFHLEGLAADAQPPLRSSAATVLV